MLNLAPPIALPRESVDAAHWLIVNEHEAAELGSRFGLPRDPASFARAQAARSGGAVVVTLGASGVLAAEDAHTWTLPAPAVQVVDTTGAGDAFVGAFAAEMSRGAPLPNALRFALAAGSLACTALGAQTAIAPREAIEALAATLD
jgi:ribokinase